MKIECIEVEQKDNGEIFENYLIDNGKYQLFMDRKRGVFPTRIGILENDRSLPWLSWNDEHNQVEIEFRGFGQLSVEGAEELIGKYQYAIEAAKVIEKQIHTP